MEQITDARMREMLATTRAYTMVLLRQTPMRRQPGADAIIWEHGRRNFSLRADALLSIVCPVTDDSDVAGLCIFDATPEETARIMDADPAVQAGILTYEAHPVRSFPGDRLPG